MEKLFFQMPCLSESYEIRSQEIYERLFDKSVDKRYKDEFNAIADIFEQYASDEELNLQPGHAYFVVSDADHSEIDNRLRYEIMPLIKEYLLDGMLARAKDDFVNYFRKRINEEMFK